ncbi:MAG: DUF362 domain-containing protein [Deltaproteobacteria bacterium]|nr:DUF362 domain-containing protein [Deltaproteobacteria bacterium]
MPSKVFFSSARANMKLSGLKKVERLFRRSGFERLFRDGDRTAVKVHWGEPGNAAYVPVPYIRTLADLVKKSGARPFVTDTNTLYAGMRHDAVANLRAAAFNGFTMETVGAPLVVADGLCGTDASPVEVAGTYVKEAKIAGSIRHATSMLVVSHFKGHMLFSFGGALKNLGMGCATSAGKQTLHSDVKPKVNRAECRGDAVCVRHCPEGCIVLDAEHKAVIDPERCVGCGECIVVCPHRAIPVNWRGSAARIQGKTAEYALAAVSGKEGRVGCVTFLINITTDCDCCDWSDTRLVQDIGYLASHDPVAIDQAAIDLFNAAPVAADSDLAVHARAADKLLALRPEIDYTYILSHAEKIGLGTRKYELVKVDI